MPGAEGHLTIRRSNAHSHPMSSRAKILFHLDQLGYGGTEKAVLTFCEQLDKSRFEPFLFVRRRDSKLRYYTRLAAAKIMPAARKSFERKYVTPLVRLAQFQSAFGPDHIFHGGIDIWKRCVAQVSPQIVHFNRGNWEPFFEAAATHLPATCRCVETNIFGREPNDVYHQRLDRYLFVSHWLMSKSPWHQGKGTVLANPIRLPAATDDLRHELGLPEGRFILGRISRPDLHDDRFLLDVLGRLPAEVHLLILGATAPIRAEAERYPNLTLIEPTTDEQRLSRFYNTLDLLLHRRIDGETFGMNIAEAMLHGRPVVSHLSSVDNAQVELLASENDSVVGFVAQEGDLDEYVGYILRLYNDRDLCRRAGEAARRHSAERYREDVVTEELQRLYEGLL